MVNVKLRYPGYKYLLCTVAMNVDRLLAHCLVPDREGRNRPKWRRLGREMVPAKINCDRRDASPFCAGEKRTLREVQTRGRSYHKIWILALEQLCVATAKRESITEREPGFYRQRQMRQRTQHDSLRAQQRWRQLSSIQVADLSPGRHRFALEQLRSRDPDPHALCGHPLDEPLLHHTDEATLQPFRLAWIQPVKGHLRAAELVHKRWLMSV